jgi:2'-5' RNA ligase
MRLFTAVELPDEVRAAVAAAAAPLLAPFPDARRVAPENLHVTVRFLGDVQPQALPAIRAALAEASSESGAGRARAQGFGAFPGPSEPRVVWAGIDDPAHAFTALERNVGERIAPLGFPPEDRPYAPHVTVARLGSPRGRPGRGRRAPADRARPFVSPPSSPLGPEFPVRELTLFESELTPRGPRYRALDRFPLAAGSS